MEIGRPACSFDTTVAGMVRPACCCFSLVEFSATPRAYALGEVFCGAQLRKIFPASFVHECCRHSLSVPIVRRHSALCYTMYAQSKRELASRCFKDDFSEHQSHRLVVNGATGPPVPSQPEPPLYAFTSVVNPELEFGGLNQ